ncbi:thiazole-phosphate synthase [Trichormus variabilis ATCC 29413]|uniref:Bifunctional protein ThiO/ThiG n=2 Tax=Anabaena variabilis TaxID=264691 RepID=THIOG_TRIV2|nr:MULTISPECIES: glycine oxidase ThiO [Nostocaceae]Q3M859.1 RecName: Full=Bifunctional protein ThiO/ThiG; Includes: RecName: Full=Probable FAD-dependent glycine oxidase; Includes: RecName: Full=Thiazole synthase [Trichormus variabilis ATCC 29413]ABA22827.1 thiazole-phosphate synthase [Trichormus variabilis ATCC 29413]MBC1216517.1 glycine oxidase ThiO [Trichormus variabilis ARAD]MBC1257722.1 glycine oxidase ThiO [Trichormus variabilis V5]MBC1268695.1 glycine oxidase ThiO [Trichormus variabilis 
MTRDIVIIGGGVIGLAIAVELKLRGTKVTVLCRDFPAAAAHAAAGMLAPDAEEITDEAMKSLCWRSRSLYPEWTSKLEDLTGLNTGYWPCGILAPVYEGQESKGVRIQENKGESPAYWLEKAVIHQYQPGLGEDVVGGWWYPEDAQVNNQALARVLWAAAESLGVELNDGITVEGLLQQQGQVVGVQTNTGIIQAEHYVLATGAWANELLPLPVTPRKGQMLRVRVPESVPELPLKRVLFGENIYIVPRRDRSIIIGATSEDVGFTPHNTPAGIQTLLQGAIRLYPQLQDYPIQEFWWGFRPATPDELPILGTSHCANLTLATGHYRNGILLAPITAALIADFIVEQKSDPLLSHFHYSRFQKQASTTPMFTHSANFSNGHAKNPPLPTLDSSLIIAGKSFHSRLMTGTGKYRSIEEMQQSVVASGCEIVTVAVRRVQTKAPGHEGLAEALDWSRIWMLPNTAGCQTAEEAIRVARLGREMAKLLGQEDNNFVKLEVIPDPKYLLPDPIGTLQAAEQLVKEGFAVLPYINADPMLAKRLEDVGCATVMPLASPIGSGQGLKTTANIQIIIENAKIPVVVDAGIGAPSEASQAMELGADALLINSAIALAQNPAAMAQAMNLATVAGRLAYLAGRMPIKTYASASSPVTGTIS